MGWVEGGKFQPKGHYHVAALPDDQFLSVLAPTLVPETQENENIPEIKEKSQGKQMISSSASSGYGGG